MISLTFVKKAYSDFSGGLPPHSLAEKEMIKSSKYQLGK